jgi:hypothetical protein
MRIGTIMNSLFMDGGTRNAGGGVTLLLAEKVHQFTCYWRTIHVMLGLQSRDHAKKRKENTGKRLEGNILLMTRHLNWFKKKTIIDIVILMLTNLSINRSYSIGSTSQLRSITMNKREKDKNKTR